LSEPAHISTFSKKLISRRWLGSGDDESFFLQAANKKATNKKMNTVFIDQ